MLNILNKAEQSKEQEEDAIEKKMAVLKMIAETLNDPCNVGKSDRLAKLAKKMSAYELTSLMQSAENAN